MKSKPFLITAAVFGSLGILTLLLTVISFFNGDSSITGSIESMLNMDEGSIKNDVLAQISVVFFIPAFIFAFRAFADNDVKHDD